MNFQPGQLVKCIRASKPGHQKLVGNIGEINQVLDSFLAFLYQVEYMVTFPCYPEGKCASCEEYHNPLYFLMVGSELAPIDDPDAGIKIEVGETITFELSQ